MGMLTLVTGADALNETHRLPTTRIVQLRRGVGMDKAAP